MSKITPKQREAAAIYCSPMACFYADGETVDVPDLEWRHCIITNKYDESHSFYECTSASNYRIYLSETMAGEQLYTLRDTGSADDYWFHGVEWKTLAEAKRCGSIRVYCANLERELIEQMTSVGKSDE